MKANLILIALLLTVATVTSCKENLVNDNSGKTGNVLQEEKENSLVGTKWKLVGFFDIEKNELKEAEPKDCEECYTLNFETDSTASGQGVDIPLFSGCYIADYISSTIQFKCYIPNVSEHGDGNMYWDILLHRISNFELKNDELNLYSNDKKNYLRYRRIYNEK